MFLFAYQSNQEFNTNSSSDRVDSGGPLRQLGMPTTGGPGPFSADAERGTVADLLYPRVARAELGVGASRSWGRNRF